MTGHSVTPNSLEDKSRPGTSMADQEATDASESSRIAVFDAHQHYGQLVLSSIAPERNADEEDSYSDRLDIDLRLQYMTDFGIDSALIMPVNRYLRPNGEADTREINNKLAIYRELEPNRFPFAVGIAEPLHGRIGLSEIHRVKEELNFIGISYHARWQGTAADDPWVFKQLAVLQELHMIPFIHAHADSRLEAPVLVGKIAQSFPDMPLIVTDAMSSGTNLIEFMSEAERFENIYMETSCMMHPLHIKLWVEKLGYERLIFGTDLYSGGRFFTMNKPSEIRGLGLGEKATQGILRDNLFSALLRAGVDVSSITGLPPGLAS